MLVGLLPSWITSQSVGKMVDDAKTLELAEIEVNRLINVIHKQGVDYRQITRILLIACETLMAMADAEYYIRQRS